MTLSKKAPELEYAPVPVFDIQQQDMQMMKELLLAIDSLEFEEITGLSKSTVEPELLPLTTLPLGVPGRPDEGRIQISTVIYDPEKQLCKMWYTAYKPFCGDLTFPAFTAYAESRDGIHWVKPELGLVEEGGSRKNNLLPPFGAGTISSILRDRDGLYRAAVDKIMLTPEMIKDEALRRQCDAIPMEAFMGIAESKDGLHWEFRGNPEKPAILEKIEMVRLSHGKNDSYVICGQQMRPWCDEPDYQRVVTFFESQDLKTWKKMPGYYQPDGIGQSHIGIARIGKFGNSFLGLAGRFHDAPELPDQYMEVDLVLSRNAYSWENLCPEHSFLRRGGACTWNCGSILQAEGCVEMGDDLYLYFSAGNLGNCPYSKIRPGYAKIKKYRFGYLALKVGWDIGFQGVRKGYLRTRKISRITANDHICINADNFERGGSIRAALMDSEGNPIHGFSFAEAIPIQKEGISIPLLWQNQPTLPEEFHISLEFSGGIFRTDSPRLYALMISENLGAD